MFTPNRGGPPLPFRVAATPFDSVRQPCIYPVSVREWDSGICSRLPTPFAPAIAFPAAVGKLGPVNGHHRPTDGRDRLRRGADGYQCPALFALVRREFRFGV